MSTLAPGAESVSDWKFFIPLTKGKIALVDEVDVMFLLNLCSWHFGNHGYAAGTLKDTRQKVLLHRIVAGRMGLIIPEQVDHTNRDRLDNRRSNLRIASRSENLTNCKARTDAAIFRGVYRNGNKFIARISVNCKVLYLGTFDSAEEASMARKLAALKYHGEFASE